MTTMVAVSVVHEDVHQRTCRQEQPRQKRNEVGAMLSEQEIPSDRGEHNEDHFHPDAPGVVVALNRVIHG